MGMYKYRGSAVTCLPLITGDVMLTPGKCAELPDDSPEVATLVAKGLLEVQAAPEAKPRAKAKE